MLNILMVKQEEQEEIYLQKVNTFKYVDKEILIVLARKPYPRAKTKLFTKFNVSNKLNN